MSSITFWLAAKGFNATREEFYEDLAQAIDDRAVLFQEIEKLAIRARQRKDPMGVVYATWLKRMERGSFSEAISTTIPRDDVMILAAYEASGRLGEGLRFLAEMTRAGREMESSIKGAVRGPMIMVVILVVMIVAFAKLSVPMMAKIYSPDKWPVMGRGLYALSQFVTSWQGVAFGVVMIGTFVAFFLSLNRWTGPVRNQFDRIPMYAIFRDFKGAAVLVGISALMQAGVSFADSIKNVRGRSTKWVQWHLSTALRRLDKDPSNPARALDTGLMPRKLADRVSDYGARSSFQEAIQKIGLGAIKNVTKEVNAKAKTINGLMLAFVGGMLAFMILGLITTSLEAQKGIKASIQQKK